MTAESRRKSQQTEADLFGPPPQGDLFGEASKQPARYIPKAEHVRSGLRAFLEKLAAAEIWWRWNDWDIAEYRERSGPYYCDLLPDPAEAEEWRRLVNIELDRLDAASGAARPYDPNVRDLPRQPGAPGPILRVIDRRS